MSMVGRAAIGMGWAAVLCIACGAAEREPVAGHGGTASEGQGGAPNGGTVVAASGGALARGGAASDGGSATGGSVTGGSAKATGGKAAATGGENSGGSNAGGNSGGASFGGTSGIGGIGGAIGAGGEAGTSGTCDGYVACGCGCCGSGPTEVTRCYYPEAGDELADLIASDRMQQASPSCATAGCSVGVRHACCLRGSPAPAGSATYSADFASTAFDRLTVMKQGNDGRCARIVFARPLANSDVYTALELPAGPGPGWGLEFAYESLCTMSASPPPAMGAIGRLALRAAAGACVVDVHLTAFFARNGGVQGVPFDAEGLTLDGVSPSLCQ